MTLALTDGTVFSNTAIKHVDIFTYSRKYTSTQWVTTILPVALSYSDWSSKFEIADITNVNVTLDSDSKLQAFDVVKTILKNGDTTVPNKPYLIRAKTANSTTAQVIKKTNCDVYPSTPQDTVIVKGNYKFTFQGVYEKISAEEIDKKYYSTKETWKQSTGTITVGPFRVILTVTEEIPQNPVNTSGINYENLVTGESQTVGKLIVNEKEVFLVKVPVVNGDTTNLEQRIKRLEDALGDLVFKVM